MAKSTATALPVRTTPRQPTEKALAKLQSQGPLKTGRPIPDAAGLHQLISQILAHLAHTEARNSLIRDIQYCHDYLESQKLPNRTHVSYGSQHTPAKLAEHKARLAEMPETLPFPEAAWEDLLAQPNEAALIRFLKDGYHFSSWAIRLYTAHLIQNGAAHEDFYVASSYDTAHQAQFSSLWATLVDRALADAASENLEFTPLLDLVWHTASSTKAFVNQRNQRSRRAQNTHLFPLVVGRPDALDCPRCQAIFSASDDPSFVSRAMQFKSAAWRQLVIQSSRAFSNPAVVLDCLNTFDEEGIKVLVTNPALSPETIELLYEWAIFQLTQTQPNFYSPERLIALLEGLESAGYPFTDSHIRRIIALIRFQPKTDIRAQIARLPQAARVPAIFNEILQKRDPAIWALLAVVAEGPTWLSLVSQVATTDQKAVHKLLKEATPEQLTGLTRRSFVPWLGHEDKEIRLAVMNLVRSLPDGEAPSLPPLPPQRKKIR